MRNCVAGLLIAFVITFFLVVPAVATSDNGPEKLPIYWEEGRGNTDWWGITADSLICLGYFHGFYSDRGRPAPLSGFELSEEKLSLR